MGNKTNLTPEDPINGEPMDKNPLYYRTHAKFIETDGDKTLQDILDGMAPQDHTHKASDIVTDDTHQFVTKEEKEKMNKGPLYTRDIPIYTPHGGIVKGTTFENKTMEEMLDMILYPYVKPTVSMSVITPSNGGVFEVGTTVQIKQIRVVITIMSNKITKIQIVNGSSILIEKTDGVTNGGVFDLDSSINIQNNSTITAKITDDSNSITTANSGAFSFVYPIYHGSLDIENSPTEAQIKSLTKHIESKGTKTYSYTHAGKRMIFAYPVSYGRISKIYDPNNFDVTGTFSIYNITLTCADNKQIGYYVYVNNKSTVTDFNMKFQW